MAALDSTAVPEVPQKSKSMIRRRWKRSHTKEASGHNARDGDEAADVEIDVDTSIPAESFTDPQPMTQSGRTTNSEDKLRRLKESGELPANANLNTLMHWGRLQRLLPTRIVDEEQELAVQRGVVEALRFPLLQEWKSIGAKPDHDCIIVPEERRANSMQQRMRR